MLRGSDGQTEGHNRKIAKWKFLTSEIFQNAYKIKRSLKPSTNRNHFHDCFQEFVEQSRLKIRLCVPLGFPWGISPVQTMIVLHVIS